MYTLQLKNDHPQIVWDPGLEILHAAAFAVTGHERAYKKLDAQLADNDTIIVFGVDSNKHGVFHLMDGDAGSVIRKYRGVVGGTTYTLHIWDTTRRFYDLKQAMGL